MPSWFPEGDTVGSKDNELRALAKWANLLYLSVGNIACQFPEGTRPLPKDTEDRLEQKIAKMLGG